MSEGYFAKPGEVVATDPLPVGRSLVFYIDPKTGKVTYPGSGPAPSGPLDDVGGGC